MDHAVQEATAGTRQGTTQPTIDGSVYVKPQELAWEPTQFDGISIKVLYEDKVKGEMTCLLKWEPGATGKTGGLALEKGERRLESCLPMGSGLPADHPRPAEPI